MDCKWCNDVGEVNQFPFSSTHSSLQLTWKEMLSGKKLPLLDTSALTHCNNEETKKYIMLYTTHTDKNGHKKILIFTVDTDVVVLTVVLACTLEEEAEVWMSFSMNKAFQFLAAHKMSGQYTLRKHRYLMFHILTGFNTVSCFDRYGWLVEGYLMPNPVYIYITYIYIL